MENLNKEPYEIYYDLWMYVFVGYCAILIFNFAMFGKVTLWNFKIKKISHYIHYTNENNNDSQ
jgi:hypothetical protein